MVPRSQGKRHRFGGDWTTQKLDVVQRYLESYATALKNKPFRKLYMRLTSGPSSRSESGSTAS